MKFEKKTIVIGGNHHNTLGVIRSLGRKGVMPYVILTSGDNNSFVLKSKYIKKSWTVKGTDAAITLMMKEFANDKEKSIVITCHDIISSQIDLNRSRLLPYFDIPGCEQEGKVTMLMNKKTMSEEAAKNGLSIPETAILNSNTIKETKGIYFPCITKPVESRLGSKSEIHVFYNINQLSDFLNENEGKNYIVQHYIVKTMEFQLIGCSLSAGQEIIIPGVSVILRQPKTTNTGFLHYRNLDESFAKTVEDTKKFIKAIEYSGLFSAEFIRDKNGIDYFMEINFRNDGNSICVTNSGVNLPYIWYLYNIGKDYTKEIRPIHDEYVMPEFAEISLYIEGIISFSQWKEDMKKATSYMDYDQKDPEPTNGWKNYRKRALLALIIKMKNKILKRRKICL